MVQNLYESLIIIIIPKVPATSREGSVYLSIAHIPLKIRCDVGNDITKERSEFIYLSDRNAVLVYRFPAAKIRDIGIYLRDRVFIIIILFTRRLFEFNDYNRLIGPWSLEK
jgi:hypothetical protein